MSCRVLLLLNKVVNFLGEGLFVDENIFKFNSVNLTKFQVIMIIVLPFSFFHSRRLQRIAFYIV